MSDPRQRVPPHDLGVEVCLLGAALLTADAARIVAQLPPGVFYSSAHGHIAAAVRRLAQHGKPTDVGSVAHQLGQDGLLEACGGIRRLTEIQDDCPATSSAGHWADVLEAAWRKRQMLVWCDRIAEAVWEGEPTEEFVAQLQAAADGVAAGTVRLTPASTIEVRPVRWVWDGRLPLGSLALLAGREGIGKSTVAYTLAADITRGRLPGVYCGQPKAVIVAATEDSWAHTIVPRLMAADADLQLVLRVDVAKVDGLETELSLPADIPALGERAREAGAALILLDPLISRLDAKLDSHKDGEVRQALEPLVRLADTCGAVVLGVIHVNKSGGSDPLNAIMGSRAFGAVARAVLFAMADPGEEHRRLLGQPKNNLGRSDLPTLTYRIDGVVVADTDEGPVWTGKLEWTGETDETITDALEAAQGPGGRTAIQEAADWLADYLAEQGGGADSSQVRAACRQAGHPIATVKRAAKRLHVDIQSHGFPRRSYWMLPGETPTPVRPLVAVRNNHDDEEF